jgi:ATP-dependent protease ClpP protease subunit
MAALYVFTVIDAPPATTYVAADAEMTLGFHVVPGRIVIAARRGELAIVAEISEPTIGRVNLVEKARRGGLSAHALVEEADGLAIIAGVRLQFGSGNAFTEDQDPAELSEDLAWWWPSITVAAMQDRPKLPPAARAPGDGVVQMEVVGLITPDSTRDLVAAIAEAESRTIAVTIDSIGGDLTSALAAYAALARHDTLVEVYIRHAHSAAAIVALAGDYRLIASDGSMMLHRPTIDARGLDAADLRHRASELDRVSAELAAIVASATGNHFEVACEWFEAENWFSAGQALMTGFCHAVADCAPSVPRPLRARVAPIAGPYEPVRPAAQQRPPLLEHGRVYGKGDRARVDGSTFQAKGRAVGAAGLLHPNVDHAQWERVR